LANDRTELIKLELANLDLHISDGLEVNVSSVCMLPFVELGLGAHCESLDHNRALVDG
jgi:hypothetical protein